MWRLVRRAVGRYQELVLAVTFLGMAAYVQRVLTKLAVSDRTQAAVVALRRSLLAER